MKQSYLTVTDQFCGAGGSSIGATAAGMELRLALNHWKLAIETHNSNFPNAAHDCTDISACDPRRYPSTDLLITSPECFPLGTLILTWRGLVPIEEVVSGDRVLTHKNRWRPVTSTMVTERETVIVRGQGHRGLEVSAQHPFYVRLQTQQWDNVKRRYNTRILGDANWISAKDLQLSSCRWASPAFVPEIPIPVIAGANARRIDFSPEFWWMVGRWLGDGTVRIREDGSNEITICCGKAEADELERLHFSPRQGPHARQSELHWRRREIRTSILFECTHDSLASWLVEHFSKGAHNKTIPAWVFGMSQEWREALLEGYVSSDGSRTERYTSISSVSKKLALGIRILVTGLGYHPSFGCYRHAAGAIEGRPFDAYDMWIVRWENNKSQRTGVNDEQHSWTLVKGVRPTGYATRVYNLSVKEDESYVADGIVVHNCTNHSIAKGKSKRPQFQPDLFGEVKIDPAEERSRATMWDVPRFAEFHRYNIIIVENVVDARSWVLWDAWLHAMTLLGYEHQCVFFNSMFAWPTPQSRDRMYVVFWKKGNKAPNLDFRPLAHCSQCERNVEAVQVWRNPHKRFGRYGKRNQYIYCCPQCDIEVTPYYYCAANAIDWSLPAQRIGDRPRPLKEKTLNRIRIGLEKFGREAHLVDFVHSGHDPSKVRPVSQPWPTQIGNVCHGLVQPPFVTDLAYTHAENNRSTQVTSSLPTQTGRQTQGLVVPPYLVDLRGENTPKELIEALSTVCASGNHHGLVMPYLTSYYGTGGASELSEAMPTVPTKDRHALVVPPFMVELYGKSSVRPVNEALSTATGMVHHALVTPPFLLSYYTRNNGLGAAVSGVEEPVPTQPTWAVHYLAQPGQTPAVEDCGFRMLQPHEIQTAMGFPGNYTVLGDGRAKVKQLGNAVTPPVMEMLIKRCAATLR